MIIPCERPPEDRITKIGELQDIFFLNWGKTETPLLTQIGDGITLVDIDGNVETFYPPTTRPYTSRHYYFHEKNVYIDKIPHKYVCPKCQGETVWTRRKTGKMKREWCLECMHSDAGSGYVTYETIQNEDGIWVKGPENRDT